MKTSTALAISLSLALGATGIADAHDDDGCRRVRATIVDTSDPMNCVSPFGFCASGTVKGNRGLNGTTYFVLDGVGRRPDSAPGWSVTSGVLVYTTDDGTLTVRETGVSKLTGSPSNGVLTSIQEIISGTGKFEGATGTLYNTAIDVNGVFTSEVSGELCLVPRKPRGTREQSASVN